MRIRRLLWLRTGHDHQFIDKRARLGIGCETKPLKPARGTRFDQDGLGCVVDARERLFRRHGQRSNETRTGKRKRRSRCEARGELRVESQRVGRVANALLREERLQGGDALQQRLNDAKRPACEKCNAVTR